MLVVSCLIQPSTILLRQSPPAFSEPSQELWACRRKSDSESLQARSWTDYAAVPSAPLCSW